MKCLTCALMFLVAVLPVLISAYPTVVVNGVCLTCPNPNGEAVYINGEEYRSFPSSNGNVIVNRPGYNSDGRTTVYRRGGTTIVNGRCEVCNVDI
ncbi:hypothetical protein ACLKA7_010775 [Drosophila subpalustris]